MVISPYGYIAIWLYRHMVISYVCNSRDYVTQVKRLVLRFLYAHDVYAFILIRRIVKEEDILPLFLICFGYSASSVWLLAACECEMSHLLWVVAMWTNCALGNESVTVDLAVSETGCPGFSWWVQLRQLCQLHLLHLCVTYLLHGAESFLRS
jgi:hypothetical protein